MSSDSSMLWERGRGWPSRSCPAQGGSRDRAEDSPSPRCSFYTTSRGALRTPRERCAPAARERHSQVVKNDEASS